MTAPATRNAPAPFTPTQIGTAAGAGSTKEDHKQQAMRNIVDKILGELRFDSREPSEKIAKRIYTLVRQKRDNGFDPIQTIVGHERFVLVGAFQSHKSGKAKTHVGIRIKGDHSGEYTEDHSLGSLQKKTS